MRWWLPSSFVLCRFYLHPIHAYLIFEKSSWKNQVRQTGFLVYFKLDVYSFCSLQKLISELIFAVLKSSSINLIFQTWFLKNQVQMDRALRCLVVLYFDQDTCHECPWLGCLSFETIDKWLSCSCNPTTSADFTNFNYQTKLKALYSAWFMKRYWSLASVNFMNQSGFDFSEQLLKVFFLNFLWANIFVIIFLKDCRGRTKNCKR